MRTSKIASNIKVIHIQCIIRKTSSFIPTPHVFREMTSASVTQSSMLLDVVMVKGTWHRWIPPLICFIFGISHLVPIFLWYFVVPEDSPKRRELFGDGVMLAAFSLMWFWAGYKQVVKVGGLSWATGSSELTLRSSSRSAY